MQRNEDATALWRKSYSRLVATRPDGSAGVGRSPTQAQAVRLSIAYAVLDNSAVITGESTLGRGTRDVELRRGIGAVLLR